MKSYLAQDIAYVNHCFLPPSDSTVGDRLAYLLEVPLEHEGPDEQRLKAP